MSTPVRSTNRIRIGGLLGGIMMLIIGSGVLFFGLQVRTWTQNEIAAMLPAEGRVVDVVSRTTAAYDASFYPVVEFRTADGEVIRFESSTGGDPPEYRVGDAVRVYYDPQAPQSAMIDSWKRWAPPLALIGVGGVAALIGVIGVFNALAASLSWGALPGSVLRALMITVVGLGILFLGWQWYASRQSRVAAMLSTQGEVVDFVSRLTSSSNRGRTYLFYPVVEFRTAEGEIIRFEGSSGSNPPMYRVGDTVRVRYDPHIPQSAVIDSWWDVLIPLIGKDYINSLDADGVALAAIQGLYGLVQEKDAEIAALRADSATMKAEITSLRAENAKLNERLAAIEQALQANGAPVHVAASPAVLPQGGIALLGMLGGLVIGGAIMYRRRAGGGR